MEDATTAPNERRDFIANLVVGAAGLFGLGGFALRFFQYLYPVVPPLQVLEVPAARRDAIPLNGGVVVTLPTGHVALVDKGGEVRAFSAVCTHLGCIVRWEGPMEHLYCPCHNGMFDRDGSVVGGPPPRPLERFPVDIREGQVFVKIKVRPKAVTA